jgi:ATP-binding cassette subfamily F protein 3
MLTLVNVRLRRGPRVLLEEASVGIFRGEKIGIVGKNGCGKSTLMALIRGEISPEAGDYTAPPELAMTSVAQELPESDTPLIEYILDGDLELRALEREIGEFEQRGDGARLALLHAEVEHLGGYAARSRAAELAAGLGFSPGDSDRPVRQLSGGLKRRANLAQALMRRSDVLLLDEPTNHLDLDAVLWLEQWLKAYPGTLLLVSHDRELLDAIAGRILHIDGGQLHSYSGNYSDFEVQHAARAERTRALIEKQERESLRVQRFVERFRATASKARQVQSRLKWLSRLGEVSQTRAESGFEWDFAAPAKLPRPLLSLDHVAAGYESRPIVNSVSLSVNPGDRIGVLGRNGAGKSTFMRVLAGQLAPLGGSLQAAPDLAIGFFAQLELEQMDADGSPLEELTRRGGPDVTRWTEQQRRDHLGRFGFQGDRVFEPTRQLSGGERARLTLAMLVARRPNLLLLDEPTNHLDLQMRESLLLALQEFAGAVIVVSHDRALLRGVCDRFLLVAEGSVSPFDGDLEDYASWLASTTCDSASEPADLKGSALSRREQRRLEAEARNRLTPLKAEERRIETELTRLSGERSQIETELADPTTYTLKAPEEQRRLTMRHAQILREIEGLEERWLEVMSALQERTA